MPKWSVLAESAKLFRNAYYVIKRHLIRRDPCDYPRLEVSVELIRHHFRLSYAESMALRQITRGYLHVSSVWSVSCFHCSFGFLQINRTRAFWIDLSAICEALFPPTGCPSGSSSARNRGWPTHCGVCSLLRLASFEIRWARLSIKTMITVEFQNTYFGLSNNFLVNSTLRCGYIFYDLQVFVRDV